MSSVNSIIHQSGEGLHMRGTPGDVIYCTEKRCPTSHDGFERMWFNCGKVVTLNDPHLATQQSVGYSE